MSKHNQMMAAELSTMIDKLIELRVDVNIFKGFEKDIVKQMSFEDISNSIAQLQGMLTKLQTSYE